VESKVNTNNNGDSTTYSPQVKYTYSVGDRGYTNDRYRYGDMGTPGNRSKQIVEAFPVGKSVDVYYPPDDPADSVLVVGLEEQLGLKSSPEDSSEVEPACDD
jgi:hypothetical protein